MTDQCKYCTYRGDIKSCKAADCFQHENWYAEEQQKQIKQLEQELEIANEGLTVAYMSGAAEVKKELNALKAHCEQLRDVLLGYNSGFPSHQADKVLNATPAQSLAEIQAQAIEEMTRQVTAFIVETGEYSTAFVITKDDVRDHIQQLLEGAK